MDNKRIKSNICKLMCTAIIALMVVFIGTDSTYAATYKKFQYKTINSGKYIEITGYKGDSENIVIPKKISGKKVTTIGQKAFSGKKKLTTVAIPDTVKTVKSYAFYNCSKLKSVTVPDSVSRIYSFAFGYKAGRKNLSGFKMYGNTGTAACKYAIYNDISYNIKGYTVQFVYTERLKSTETIVQWGAAQGAAGYAVYRADKLGKSYKKIATVKDTVYTDDSVPDGNTYYYRIKPYKKYSGEKIYGSFSESKISEWGKYNKAEFENVTRNKINMTDKQGVYYEIFVRSFADSDGDGVGDFNGVTAKLDYLKDLGIEGIWLMPVNQSSSYHGYDIDDYYLLNGDYGTEEDFQNLINEAHKRGIKIIMDFVLNHTGSNNAWFRDALNNVHSKYRDYYRFVSKYDTDNYDEYDESPWGSLVWKQAGSYYYYSIFYGMMPDLNYNNPAVRQEIKSAAGKWLNMGIDGFRLDAAMHIYGENEFKQMSDEERKQANLQWWNEFASYCESINENVYLVGEAWQNDEVLSEYVQPFDTKFNFTFEQNMMNAVVNEKATVNDSESLSQNLTDILQEYSKVDTKYIDGVFGTNHDQNRIMSQVEGNTDKAKLVADIYLTLPGNPFIYYGEELGMYGDGDDENKRTPFKWSEDGKAMDTTWEDNSQNKDVNPYSVQVNDENSMYNHYKKMIALRKSEKALVYGTYSPINVDNSAVMAYVREYEGEKITVVHNLSAEAVSVAVSDVQGGNVIFGQTDALAEGNITVPAYGTVMVKVS